jgi:raffinose/stachyose/melibiose transport system substrate-binding protein
MARNPGVTVEQIAIPRRAWSSWMETQLIGGTAPDLIQLVNNDPNPILRHFRPIDDWVEEPNPYNAGTDLEGIPWKDTFIAPLTDPPAYWPFFLNYYSVPTTLFTIRMYYNRDLLREITGAGSVPETYEEFLALCRRVEDFASAQGRQLYPVAGARPVPPFDALFHRLMTSQTQRLAETVDPTYTLGGAGAGSGDVRAHSRDAYFRRVWDLRSPEIRKGFELVREVGSFFQPGFLQAERDAAIFYFLQKRTLMMPSGSWDFTSLQEQADFQIGVFPVPVPSVNHPDYGSTMYGPPSEANTSMRGAFALTKQSPHASQAIDFLRFLTSKEAHQRFADISGWLPAVRGVRPQEEARDFYPIMEGYPPGFAFNTGVDTTRLWETHAHLLFSGEDGVERLTRALEPQMDDAIVRDELKESRESVASIAAYDALQAADFALKKAGADPLLDEQRLSELWEAQAFREDAYLRSQYLLETFVPRR